MNTKSSLINKLKNLKILFLDFDGVMTDGYVYVSQDGVETVRCSRRDSLGIAILQKKGIKVGVVSKETNNVVTKRCKKLNIPCWQGIRDGQGKKEIITKVLQESHISPLESAYMGDDVNDIPAMESIGIRFTVADADPRVKKIAHYATRAAGGCHAIREICNLILQVKNIDLQY